MDRGMGGALPIEKLNRSNYASWEYKIHQYLIGNGYWSYIHGGNEVAPDSIHKDFPAWEQAARLKVLYCVASSVHIQMLGYIRDAKTPKEASENLKKIFTTSTTARKLQLRQELNNIRQRDMTVTEYTQRSKRSAMPQGPSICQWTKRKWYRSPQVVQLKGIG